MSFQIVGVHPVEAGEPCHLIEVALSESGHTFDWGAVTQEVSDQPASEWQVAYDEQPLDDSGKRWVFFFHYLDPSQPLRTPLELVALPAVTALPEHLKSIEYCPP